MSLKAQLSANCDLDFSPEGEIRDAAFTLEGDIRVGLEFTGLSKTEQAITAILSGINTIEPKTAAPRTVR